MASDLFQNFRRDEDVYLIRYNPGKFRDGIFTGTRLWKKRLKSGYSVQPVTEADDALLPDGLTRTTSVIKIFTTEIVYASRADKGIQADEIEVAGVLYRIDNVNNYSFGTLAHYESIAMKVAE